MELRSFSPFTVGTVNSTPPLDHTDVEKAEKWMKIKTVVLRCLEFLALTVATLAVLALAGAITTVLAPEILITAVVVAAVAFLVLGSCDLKRSHYYTRFKPKVLKLREALKELDKKFMSTLLDKDMLNQPKKLQDVENLQQQCLKLLKDILERTPEDSVIEQWNSLAHAWENHKRS